MKHYPHHIGDFNSATRHLTRIERSIYRDLIDLYYDTEAMLPLDVSWVCRKILAHSNEESTAVEQVLNEFFDKTPDGWYHLRCEEELDKYRSNNSQKAEAGKASAAKRALMRQQALNGKSTSVEIPLNGASTNHQPSTNQPTKEEPPPAGDESPADPIWHTGLSFLIRKGIPKAKARKFLGKLKKEAGDIQAAGLLARCESEDITDPVPWLSAGAIRAKEQNRIPQVNTSMGASPAVVKTPEQEEADRLEGLKHMASLGSKEAQAELAMLFGVHG